MKAEAKVPLPLGADRAATTSSAWRVDAVDLLRGVVMVVMLLDHTREFFHREVLNFDPADLTKTNTLL
jgi:uncharacterized membrane protein